MVLLLLAGFSCLPLLALAQAPRPKAAAKSPPADPLQAGNLPVPQAPPGTLPTVEPIITDQEFNAAIPALSPDDDPELNQRLETIDEFERGLKAKPAATTAAGQPAANPAADLTQQAELLKPLPPLAEFTVTPVEFVQGAEDTVVVELDYAVRVEGLDTTASQSRINLDSSFRGLSVLNHGKGHAANLAQLNGRISEDTLLLKKLLASQGWFDPQVRSRIDRLSLARAG